VLWERELETDGEPFDYSDFAGIVGAICPGSGELVISADDIRQSGQDLTFAVPDEIDVSELEVGQSVAATATISEDGALELEGIASEEGRRAADDAKLIQGDLAG
jgi:hypothetical protein